MIFLQTATITEKASSTIGLGGFNFGGGTFASVLMWVLITIVLGIAVCGTIIYFVWKRSYTERAVIWAKISGVVQKIGTYPAKWLPVGRAGDRLFFIRGLKRWQLPKIRAGKNEWNFFVRELDGELINFGFEDVDLKMQRMGMRIIDGDVRMQRLGIEKNLKERHQKQRDWAQIIMNIAFIVTFIIIFIGLVVLFSKLTEVAESLDRSSKSVGDLADSLLEIGKIIPDNEFRPETIEEGLVPIT